MIKNIILLLVIIPFVIRIDISGQNIRSGSFIDLFWISDSLSYDSKRISFGGTFSANNLNFSNVNNSSIYQNTGNINLAYYRLYKPVERNNHDFVMLNSVNLGVGFNEFDNLSNKGKLNFVSFIREKGIGYRFSNYTIIPFTSSGSLYYLTNGKNFSGKNRAIGVNINFYDFIDFSVSYNNTNFSTNSNFTEKITSRAIESATKHFMNVGLSYLLPDSKFYPVYYWLINAAFNYGLMELNENNYNFPFNHGKSFNVSNINFSIKYDLNLFN